MGIKIIIEVSCLCLREGSLERDIQVYKFGQGERTYQNREKIKFIYVRTLTVKISSVTLLEMATHRNNCNSYTEPELIIKNKFV